MHIRSYKVKAIPAVVCAVVAGASLLTSCALDTPEIPNEEIYTREFIKRFGLIDASHDFNMATQAMVTVTSATPADVKIYADVSGTRYLFGTYLNVSGTRELSVDVPAGISSLILKSAGRTYTTAPGGKVNLSAPASRDDSQASESAEGSIQTVTVQTLEGDHSYLTLNWTEINSFKNILGEKGDSYSNYKDTNLGVPGVSKNFIAKAKTFWIFPQYWDTGSYKTNVIGVYYYVDEQHKDSPGVIAVNYRTSGVETPEETETRYIVRQEIFNTQTNKDNLKRVSCEYEYTGKIVYWSDFSSDVQQEIFTKLMELKPDIYQIADGVTHANEGNLYAEGTWLAYSTEWNYWDTLEYYFTWSSIITDDIRSVCPDIPYGNGSFCSDVVVTRTEGDDVANVQTIGHLSGNVDELRSYGIQVTFDRYTQFGFYIKYNEANIFYSEKELNEIISFEDVGDVEAAYVSTFINPEDPTDTNLNDKRYLLFEDWPAWHGKNFDLNDMVFRVYGFDHIEADVPVDIPEGGLVDKEEEKEETPDKPFGWIIACEDLGTADDFDFNDVVFAVSEPTVVYSEENPETPVSATVKVQALAAGGTLEAHIMYKNKNGVIKEVGKEIHSWFGNFGTTTIINTGYGVDRKEGATVTVDVDTDFSLAYNARVNGNMGGFYINVTSSDGNIYEIKAPTPYDKEGQNSPAPQMLCLPYTWIWPAERMGIENAYPEFNNWVSKKSDANEKWYDPAEAVVKTDLLYKYWPSSAAK